MSHVAMAEHICPICLTKHTYNTEILLHKQLKDIPEDRRVTGYGLCEEHQRLADEGYIALVEATAPKEGNTLKQEEALRTGRIAHLKRDVFSEVFDQEAPDLDMVFVDVGVLDMLDKMQGE